MKIVTNCWVAHCIASPWDVCDIHLYALTSSYLDLFCLVLFNVFGHIRCPLYLAGRRTPSRDKGHKTEKSGLDVGEVQVNSQDTQESWQPVNDRHGYHLVYWLFSSTFSSIAVSRSQSGLEVHLWSCCRIWHLRSFSCTLQSCPCWCYSLTSWTARHLSIKRVNRLIMIDLLKISVWDMTLLGSNEKNSHGCILKNISNKGWKFFQHCFLRSHVNGGTTILEAGTRKATVTTLLSIFSSSVGLKNLHRAAACITVTSGSWLWISNGHASHLSETRIALLWLNIAQCASRMASASSQTATCGENGVAGFGLHLGDCALFHPEHCRHESGNGGWNRLCSLEAWVSWAVIWWKKSETCPADFAGFWCSIGFRSQSPTPRPLTLQFERINALLNIVHPSTLQRWRWRTEKKAFAWDTTPGALEKQSELHVQFLACVLHVMISFWFNHLGHHTKKTRHVATHLCVLAGQQNHVVWVESSQISVVVQTLKSCLPFLVASSCGTCMSCVRSPRRDGWVGQVGSNYRCQFLPSNAKDGMWPAVMRCCRFLRIESSK